MLSIVNCHHQRVNNKTPWDTVPCHFLSSFIIFDHFHKLHPPLSSHLPPPSPHDCYKKTPPFIFCVGTLSSISELCLAHFSLLGFAILKYSLLCLKSPNLFPRTLFSNTYSLCSSLILLGLKWFSTLHESLKLNYGPGTMPLHTLLPCH